MEKRGLRSYYGIKRRSRVIKIGKIICIILSSILLSCSQPNIYSNLGLYDPIKERAFETVELEENRAFNLLSISPSYSGRINLKYTPGTDYEILKQLKKNDVTALIQTVSYLSRFGGLEEYLATPLTANQKTVCRETKAFATEIIEEVKSCIIDVIKEIEEYNQSIDSLVVTDFFDGLIELISPDKGCDTIEDYIAIQLTLDIIASSIDMLYTILIDLPTEATTYAWEELTERDGFLSRADTITSIRENALTIVSILLNSASEIDLIGGNIPSFINLETIIGKLI